MTTGLCSGPSWRLPWMRCSCSILLGPSPLSRRTMQCSGVWGSSTVSSCMRTWWLLWGPGWISGPPSSPMSARTSSSRSTNSISTLWETLFLSFSTWTGNYIFANHIDEKFNFVSFLGPTFSPNCTRISRPSWSSCSSLWWLTRMCTWPPGACRGWQPSTQRTEQSFPW